MIKKLWKKKEYILIVVIIILFAAVSFLSLTSIQQLRGNARVVNYVGIVRGATQKLVKEEIMNYPDDALVTRLDGIISELITGDGENGLIVLEDPTYLANMHTVQQSWNALKEDIYDVRAGADNQALFDASQEYFLLVDRTVSSAEAFSEQQVDWSTKMLLGVNGVFVLILVVGVLFYIRSSAVKKQADLLGKIAYLDSLTQIPNRARCQQELDRYTVEKPSSPIAVFMFDMNNLKRANDVLGHLGGDRIIADFARVIKAEGDSHGFVGRFGGDEFIAIFPDATADLASEYISRINEKIVAYNLLHINEVEKISFAVGYVIGNLQMTTVDEMINQADQRMYERKRQMKENKILV